MKIRQQPKVTRKMILSPANDGETDEKKDASSADSTKAETTMEKASTEVTELIQSYYKAFRGKRHCNT